ncbi:hypothetical protein PanWU01x14_273180, partial [Parasponia andersonii]
IKSASTSIPFTMRRSIFKVLSSFRSGQAIESDEKIWIIVFGVEKKRKSKALAVERAKHVMRTREMKTMVVTADFQEETDKEVESMLKERRVVVRLGGSSF